MGVNCFVWFRLPTVPRYYQLQELYQVNYLISLFHFTVYLFFINCPYRHILSPHWAVWIFFPFPFPFFKKSITNEYFPAYLRIPLGTLGIFCMTKNTFWCFRVSQWNTPCVTYLDFARRGVGVGWGLRWGTKSHPPPVLEVLNRPPPYLDCEILPCTISAYLHKDYRYELYCSGELNL